MRSQAQLQRHQGDGLAGRLVPSTPLIDGPDPAAPPCPPQIAPDDHPVDNPARPVESTRGVSVDRAIFNSRLASLWVVF